MIICSASNIDLVQGQGTEGYGNADGTTDWRITNTPSATLGLTGVFNIFNSVNPTTPSISILESGTVGIGTVPNVSSAAKMEIIGGINISGSYNRNNRDVINDTSNYILNTSNILVSRINAGGGSGGAITSGGNLTLTNNATSNTILSIANSNINVGGPTPVITPTNVSGGTFSVGQITSTANSTDRFMIFTAGTSSFTVPTGGIVCDILMIGGGGAGGYSGGGGGAGACIIAINQTLSTTGVYNVVVGTGDVASGIAAGTGGDSTIGLNGGSTLYIAKGGGRGERTNNGRNNGGCGGGSGNSAIKTGGLAVNTNLVAGTLVDANARGATFAVFGNKGGDRPDSSSGVGGVGGGGIGGAGGNHLAGNINAGPGGVGLFQATVGGTTYNFRSYFSNGGTPYNFGALNSVDSQYYIGGGGGGSVDTSTNATGPNVGGIGGVGGGGAGGIGTTYTPSTGAYAGAVNPVAGAANTGGGGGGGYNGALGGNGGSGIVIIRYRAPPATVGVPSVELIRGIAGDSNHDYKVGNYDGNFKIMSAVSGASDVERLNISSVGNVGIGTSSPSNELHIFDSTTSATSLIIQNNNSLITSNTVQGTSTVQASTQTTSTTASTFTATFSDNSPTIHEQVTGSTDWIIIIKNASVSHTFTVPTDGLSCDILMIGAGAPYGGSGQGGGAGACIMAINHTLPAGTCVLRVGRASTYYNNADSANPYAYGTLNGGDSYITVGGNYRYIARGGGGSSGGTGRSGGCGSGGGGGVVSTNMVDGSTATIGPGVASTYVVMGNAGGAGGSGGGGGIGGVGESGGNGGIGAYQATTLLYGTYNFRNHFANGGNNFGEQIGPIGAYYIGGGGSQVGNGGYGKSGEGGGGGTYARDGLIIIRYRTQITTNTTVTTTTYTHTPTITTTLSTPTLGTPSIELVRGTQGDSNTDYKIGNYGGDFIVKSSVSNTDTDYLRISSTGAITNPTGTASWNTGSDRRIKENIERASYDKCYESICRLELNRFNYIKGFNTVSRDNKQLGFIAQEVNDIFPKAITSQAYYSDVLSIPDLLSIDVSQINYSLYGAVKKLIEINNNKELRLKKLECLLNVDSDGGSDSSNVVIMDDVLSSNVVIEDTMSSNVVIMDDVLSSNVIISEDTMSSNVVIIEDVLSSNVVIMDDTNNI